MTTTEKQILGLTKLAEAINTYLQGNDGSYADNYQVFEAVLKRSEIENPWFTLESQKMALQQWASLLTKENLEAWVSKYRISMFPKKVGLILAGNIPMVGFHDIISVVLSGNIPLLKLSSKDKTLIPYLLNIWKENSDNSVHYEIVEKLENFDAVIATGSNNTARYLEYYFKNHLNIIRKNRTSVAVLKGDETDEQIKLLAKDIFQYFGLGCRNVTRLFIPKDFPLERLFENFIDFQDVINHNKYANNYDYNRAVFLLNKDKFWDNNFVLLKEDEKLFSPLSVVNFSRYKNIDEVKNFLTENEAEIQCVVAEKSLQIPNSVDFGEAQNPSLGTYADNVDTMKFLEIV